MSRWFKLSRVYLNIGVIGTEYVGLVSGACFAEFGHNVVCIDNDKSKIKKLNSGFEVIYEPGLDVILNKTMESKRLTFDTDISKFIDQLEVIFIAVGTPPRKDDNAADLKNVFDVAEMVGSLLKESQLLVISPQFRWY